MILTTRSRYAVLAVLEVATREAGCPTKLSDISVSQDISISYLEQIFPQLKKANIVKSVRGPGGGYLLNDSLDKISIISIIDAVEENLKMTRCSQDQRCMKDGIKCKGHYLWKGLTKQIRSYFAEISLSDVLTGQIKI
ncbi:MAG: Rrf2 family transcriptional regulator [Rickettsiaceae bacterium]|nr:Rrf2 family transcriptional regulator [Rickettsiaceae bacterium]